MNRRTRTNSKKIKYAESSSDSEGNVDTSWIQEQLELLSNAIRHSTSRKCKPVGNSSRRNSGKLQRPKKKTRTNRFQQSIDKVAKSSKNESATTSTIVHEVEIEDQSKKVEDKVEAFFRAHNLISDDEDNTENKAKCPPKYSKEFYELSDSEDNSTVVCLEDKSLVDESDSNKILEIIDQTVNPNPEEKNLKLTEEVVDLVENSDPNKDDELMDVVDKILEISDKPIDANLENKDQSWTDYKTKTEEFLGNITSLLSEISSSTKPQAPDPPKQLSPTPAKSTCPICLETLGGDIPAMATTCGHIFCKPCIEQVAKSAKKCPTCRKNVTRNKIHPIYL